MGSGPLLCVIVHGLAQFALRAEATIGETIAMTSLPITPEQLAALPPEVQAVVQAIVERYEARIAGLESELAAARKTP